MRKGQQNHTRDSGGKAPCEELIGILFLCVTGYDKLKPCLFSSARPVVSPCLFHLGMCSLAPLCSKFLHQSQLAPRGHSLKRSGFWDGKGSLAEEWRAVAKQGMEGLMADFSLRQVRHCLTSPGNPGLTLSALPEVPCREPSCSRCPGSAGFHKTLFSNVRRCRCSSEADFIRLFIIELKVPELI